MKSISIPRCVYIWSGKGKNEILNVSLKGTILSVIAAVRIEGICGFQMFKAGVTSKDFGAFMCNYSNNTPSIKENLDRTIFFINRAATHKAKAPTKNQLAPKR